MMPAVLWPNGSANIPRVTSEFNPARKNPVTGIVQPHTGIDLVGWSTILSPVDGVVTFAGYNGGAGNEVRIRADGPNAFIKGDVFRLFHNRELWVRTGQRVTQAQGVAVMGTTGNSTGTHCHFETRPGGGSAINPRDYMASRNAGTTGGGSSEEDDMTPDQDARLRNIENLLAGGGPSLTDPDYRAAPGTVLQHLQNLTGFVYAGGTSAADPKYRGAPGTIYALLKTPVQRTVDGKAVEISQIQELADGKTIGMRTEAKVDQLLARPTGMVSDAQVKAIADAVAEQIGTPTVKIDYAAIAKAVNDDAAARLVD